MRRLLSALLALFACLPLFADEFRVATAAEMAMKDAAIAPGASAVILDWAQRRSDSDFRESEYVRIKILKEEGKKYGNIELPHLPLLFNVEHLKARVTQPDGRVVDFNGKVYDKTLIKAGGVRVVSKTFTIPDVQVGSIIEYYYELGFRGDIIYDTRFKVQRELPVLHEILTLKPFTMGMDHMSTFFVYKDLPPGKSPVKKGDHFELELENVPAFEKEPFEPPDEQIKPQVLFFYLEGRKVDTAEFWSKIDKDWTETIERFISNRSGIRDEAQKVIAGASTPEEKLRKLYARTQQIRNLSFEPDKTEQEEKALRENHNIEDVLRNGYGWRDQITRLFVGLARGAGFDANIVRIGARDETFLSKNLLVGSQLNNEVALVTLDGKPRLFDPSTPYASFGLVSWEKTRTSGLKISNKEKTPVWLDIPENSESSAVMTRKATVRVDGDGLKATAVVTLTGQEALTERLARRNDDEAAAKKAIEEQAKGWFADGSGVKLTKVTGLRDAEQPLVEEFEVTLPTTGTLVGSRALIPMAIFSAAQKPPFPSEQRRNDVYFNHEYQVQDDVTLEVPDGYGIESIPGANKLDLGALTYTTAYDHDAKRVHYTRTLQVMTTAVDKTKYSAVRTFFNKVATADQDQLVLRKSGKAAGSH